MATMQPSTLALLNTLTANIQGRAAARSGVSADPITANTPVQGSFGRSYSGQPSTEGSLADLSSRLMTGNAATNQQVAAPAPMPLNAVPSAPVGAGPAPIANPVKPEGFPTPQTADQIAQENPSLLNRILDIVSRPRYAVENVIKDAIAIGDPTNKQSFNPLESIGAGIEGIDKTSGADIINQIDKNTGKETPGPVKAILGLAGDVGFDPLSYTTFGLGAAVKAGATAVKDVAQGTKATNAAIAAGKTLMHVDEAAVPGSTAAKAMASPVKLAERAVSTGDSAPGATAAADLIPAAKVAEPSVADSIRAAQPAPFTAPFVLPDHPTGVAPSNLAPVAESITPPLDAIKTEPLHAVQPSEAPIEPIGSPHPVPESAPTAISEPPVVDPAAPESLAQKITPPVDSVAPVEPSAPFVPQGISPERYQLATDHVANSEKATVSTRDLQNAGLNYRESRTALDNLEANKLVGAAPEVTATGRASQVRPILNSTLDANNVAKDASIGAIVDHVAPGLDPSAVSKIAAGAKAPMFRDANAQMHDTWKTMSDLSNENKGLTGAQHAARADIMQQGLVDRLTTLKDTNVAKGIYPIVKTKMGAYHLDAADVMSSLGPKVKDYVISQPRFGGVPPSTLIHGAAATLDAKQAGMATDQALSHIASAVQKGHNTTQAISTSRASRIAHDLWARSDDLHQRVFNNEVSFGLRDATTGKEIGQRAADNVKSIVTDPMSNISDAVKAVADVNGSIARAVKDEGLSTGGAFVGAAHAANELKGVIADGDVAAAKSIQAVARDTMAGDVARVNSRLAKQAQLDAEEAARQLSPLVSLDETTGYILDHSFQRMFSGLAAKSEFGYQQGQWAGLLRNGLAGQEAIRHLYTQQLSDLYKSSTEEQRIAGWLQLQTGHVIADPAIKAVADTMHPMMDHLLSMGTGADSVVQSGILRNGIDFPTFNALIKEHGLPYQFSLGTKGETPDQIMAQWKTWTIKGDPLKFMDRMHAAVSTGVARKGVWMDMERQFAKDHAAPGFSRLARTDARMSHYATPGKYYPNEALDAFRVLDKMMKAPRSFKGQTGLIANFANNVVDPYLAVWKPSVTIIKPGHHVRNIFGDYMMGAEDGVWSGKWYMKAANIQRAGGDFKGNTEALRNLTKDGRLPDGTGHALSVTLKGNKVVNLSNGQAYAQVFRDGLLPSYKVSEDILDLGGGIGQKIANRVQKNAVVKAGGAFAETYSHGFRIAHYSKLMSSPKFTKQFDTVHDASNAAITRVQKFHPDSQGLAPAEAKYMRRTVPFYTWFRQAMPRVFTAFLEKPGRLTAIPKLFQNTQVAMGINNTNTTNPFDPSHMYPSFIQDHLTGNLGIGGTSFTADLGSPIEALGGQINGNSGNTLGDLFNNAVGMVNPLIKAPVELGTSNKIGGGFIADKGEYIDQMLPFVNDVANISGYSPSGTASNVFGSTGFQLDPQRAMVKGEKDAFFNTSTLNFLSGLSIQNLNRPSYQALAAKGK